MSIKPVFFNREMVKAILDGKKTVMRVPVKCHGYKVVGSPAWAKGWSGPDRFFEVSRLDASKEDMPNLQQVGYINDYNGDANRVYSGDGVSRTLKADVGGGGAKTGWYTVPRSA